MIAHVPVHPQEEYPEYPELLRMAVSLGRRLQEPLVEFTALASSPDEEIFALKMHPLQDSLPKEKLKEALELEMVTRVNDVGVDVNYVLNYPHASSMLNYVCGLGPRKAAALLKVSLLAFSLSLSLSLSLSPVCVMM